MTRGSSLSTLIALSPARLDDVYGGKRAFVRYLASRTLAACGAYRALERPDFSRVRRLVFVCKGNVCRSPYAEYVARSFGLNATSAGLEARPGSPAYPRALEVAMRRGIDLSHHRARCLDQLKLERTDLLVAFEAEHALPLRRISGPDRSLQLTLIGLFASVPHGYLHDPYGLSEPYFETCFLRIEDALRGLCTRFDNLSGIAGAL